MRNYEQKKCTVYGISCPFALDLPWTQRNCFASERDCDKARMMYRTRSAEQEKPVLAKEGKLEVVAASSS